MNNINPFLNKLILQISLIWFDKANPKQSKYLQINLNLPATLFVKQLFNSIILLCFSLMYWSRRTLWRMLSMRSVCQVMPLSCQCSSAFLRFATLPWYRSIPRNLKTKERGLKVNEHKMRVVVDVVIGYLLLPSIYCSILQNQDLKTTASQIASNNTGRGL